jgi:hypothetical protein
VESSEWTNPNWQAVELNLADYAGAESVRLRFSLTVDDAVSDKGWIIDDLIITASDGQGGINRVFLPIILKDQ